MDICIINIRAHIFESYILNRISCGEMGWEHVYSGTVKYHLDYFIGDFFSVTLE